MSSIGFPIPCSIPKCKPSNIFMLFLVLHFGAFILVSLLYKGSTFVYVLKPRASCFSGFCSPHFSLLYYQSFLLPSLLAQWLSPGIILLPMPMSGDIFYVTCGVPGIQFIGVTDAAKHTTMQ